MGKKKGLLAKQQAPEGLVYLGREQVLHEGSLAGGLPTKTLPAALRLDRFFRVAPHQRFLEAKQPLKLFFDIKLLA